jgi:hypothetical protein
VLGSKGFLRVLTVGAATVSLCALGPVATAVAQDPNLVGTWTGHRERIASTEGYRNGTATLVVTEQIGLTFKGYMQWSTPEGPLQDDLVGAFTPDGTLVAGADAEGTYSFKLVDPVTLDYCYAENGEGFRTTCARLQRQP